MKARATKSDGLIHIPVGTFVGVYGPWVLFKKDTEKYQLTIAEFQLATS